MIYMDNAATTRLKDSALEAMMPYFKDEYFNPGGVYDPGQSVKKAVAGSREDISLTLNANPREVFFTSGGTESDNMALRGILEKERDVYFVPHIITTAFEHHAVLNTCRYLERIGLARISYINPGTNGLVGLSDIEREINKDTVMVSVMHVNNELGTCQPVEDIGRMAHDHGILFHTDAIASYGHLPIDVKEMNIDLLSASSHKFGGPKGVGFLYVREDIKLPPLLLGGAQERGRRAGTENVPGIIGMAAAAREMHACMDSNLERRRRLDDHFRKCWMRRLPRYTACQPGQYHPRIPGHFCITLPGVNAEELVVKLGMDGICISTGAACASSEDAGSHVLRSIGLKGDALKSTVRISINEDNTEEEIDTLLEKISSISGGKK